MLQQQYINPTQLIIYAGVFKRDGNIGVHEDLQILEVDTEGQTGTELRTSRGNAATRISRRY